MLSKKHYLTNIEVIKELEVASNEKLSQYRGWGSLWRYVDELKQMELVPSKSLELIERSALTAYYTEPKLIQAMWQILENSGFAGGCILDPCCGIGNFFSEMPERIKKKSQLVGIEIEPIAAQIAKRLHPEAIICQQGFEAFRCPDNYFDLSISNIPFSISRLHEPRYSYLKPSLHELFILKMIDLTKIGGIIATIVSTNFLDKQDETIRSILDKGAKLLSTWRLPSEMFQNSAGIKIATDVIFLEKTEYSDNNTTKHEKSTWVSSLKFPEGNASLNDLLEENQKFYQNNLSGNEEIDNKLKESECLEYLEELNNTNEKTEEAEKDTCYIINRYYVENYEHILGQLHTRMNQYGRKQLDLKSENCEKVIDYLKSKKLDWSQTLINEFEKPSEILSELFNEKVQSVQPGSFVKIDNLYYFTTGKDIQKITKPSKIEKIDTMKAIAETVRSIYNIYEKAENASDDEINQLQEELRKLQLEFNELHHKFRSKWGEIQDKNNDELNVDSDYYLICSTINDNRIVPLFKDLKLKRKETQYKTIEDIYNYCLSVKGELELEWIEKTVKEWLQAKTTRESGDDTVLTRQ